MITEISQRKINAISNLARRQEYTFITKNCNMYMVKDNGNKHWLCNNKILTEWVETGHTDNFESWTFPDVKTAKEHFNDRSFDKEW